MYLTLEESSSLRFKHRKSGVLMACPCLYSFSSSFLPPSFPQLHSAVYKTTICRPLDDGTSSPPFWELLNISSHLQIQTAHFLSKLKKSAWTALEVREGMVSRGRAKSRDETEEKRR